MLQSLGLPTCTYGCEITGYDLFEDLEVIQGRYFKWVLGLADEMLQEWWLSAIRNVQATG